jgi:hypothetical protein
VEPSSSSVSTDEIHEVYSSRSVRTYKWAIQDREDVLQKLRKLYVSEPVTTPQLSFVKTFVKRSAWYYSKCASDKAQSDDKSVFSSFQFTFSLRKVPAARQGGTERSGEGERCHSRKCDSA